jgi:hypothetical protein
VLPKNESHSLSGDRNKIRSIAVLGRLAPEIPPTGFDSSFLEAIRSVSELSGSLAEDGTDVGVAFLPPSTCKGAIRVSSRERAVLRIGNKARPFLVFIGNETPTGVWRNKPADFLDMKLVRYVSHSWCDHLVTHHVSGLLHQQKNRKREYGKPRLGGLNSPITRQHRKPIYKKRSYEKHCFLLSSPYPRADSLAS